MQITAQYPWSYRGKACFGLTWIRRQWRRQQQRLVLKPLASLRLHQPAVTFTGYGSSISTASVIGGSTREVQPLRVRKEKQRTAVMMIFFIFYRSMQFCLPPGISLIQWDRLMVLGLFCRSVVNRGCKLQVA